MPNAIILLNGQKFELDESLVATDQHVRDALAPYAPDIQTAQIARSTKDGQVVITIIPAVRLWLRTEGQLTSGSLASSRAA